MSSVRQSGTIVKWDDEKGSGFIEPDAGAGDVFVHAKVVVGARRPIVGDRVIFFPEKDNQGRSRALQMQFENRSRLRSSSACALVFAAAFLAALALAAWSGRITPVLPVIYALLSAVTFGAYRHDKNSALHGGRRMSENALHLLEVFGGWPGALVAQQWFRHKTRKLSYQVIFWTIVAAHFGAWVYFAPRR